MAIWTPSRRLIKPPPNARPTTYRGRQNMVGAWLFSDYPKLLGETIDYSGNGNHGTLVADTHSVPGKFGNALDFDGTGDQVNCGVLYQVWTPITQVSFGGWIYIPSGGAANQVWIRQRRGSTTSFFNLYKSNQTLLGDVQHTSGGSGSASVFNWFVGRYDQWHQIFVTWDGTTITLYADGIAIDQDALSGVFDDLGSERDLLLGNTLVGRMDNASVYNRALAASEIISLYRDPFQGWRREPIELWSDKTAAAPSDIVILRRRREET